MTKYSATDDLQSKLNRSIAELQEAVDKKRCTEAIFNDAQNQLAAARSAYRVAANAEKDSHTSNEPEFNNIYPHTYDIAAEAYEKAKSKHEEAEAEYKFASYELLRIKLVIETFMREISHNMGLEIVAELVQKR